MGIIVKQTIKGTTYSYIGIALGFLISGILLPNIFSTSENGLLKLLVSFSILFARFANLGFNGVINRLFPYFRNKEKKHNGFLFIALTVVSVGFLLSVVVFFILKPTIIQNNIKKSELFVKYIYYLIPLIFFTVIFDLLDTYNRILYNATLGIFLKEVLQRVFILLSIGLYYFNVVDFNGAVLLYALSLSMPAIFITAYLIYARQFNLTPQLSFVSKDLAKKMIDVAAFGLIGGFAGIIILNIDAIMVNSMIDIKATGIYGITFFFGSVILAPSRSLLKISIPVLSEAMKKNDLETINSIYKKTCLNQFIIGSLIFVGIWANIHNVFKILPPVYEAGKYVIFFISLANLTDMIIGANGVIIGLSKYYRYQTYLSVFLAIFVIITNYIFIPIFGITGAALASFISKLLFNLTRYVFVLKKLKMQPYNIKFLLVLLIAGISYFVGYIIPKFDNFIVDIIIRSISISLVFVGITLILKLSDDFNLLFNKIRLSLIHKK